MADDSGGPHLIETTAEREIREQAEERSRQNKYRKLQIIFNGVLTVATLITGGIVLLQNNILREGNSTNREALIAVQRAFVSPIILGVRPIIDGGIKSISGWEVQLHWENNGTTPARSVFAHMSSEERKSPLPKDFTFPDQWADGASRERYATFIGPKGRMGVPGLVITRANVTAVQGGGYFYFWGWIRYRDVFSATKEHITKVCAELKSTSTTANLGTFPFTFNANACPEHNCTDEDCKTN